MPRPREFDEDAVLRKARDQFWSTGYAGTSMDAVASATGLGKGSLYGAFGDKRALYARVFDGYCADITAAIERAHQGTDEEALERLRDRLRGSAASVASDTAHRGCMLAKGVAELAEHDEQIASRSLQTLDALEAALVRDIDAARRAGDLDPEADAHALAALLVTVMRGLEAVGKAGKDPQALAAIAEAAIGVLPTTGRAPARTRRRGDGSAS